MRFRLSSPSTLGLLTLLSLAGLEARPLAAQQAPAAAPAPALQARYDEFWCLPNLILRGTLNVAGDSQAQPLAYAGRQSVWFFPAGRNGFPLRFCLGGPAGTNFQLYIDRLEGNVWRTVAQGTDFSHEQRVFLGYAGGYYRARVVSAFGSGAYELYVEGTRLDLSP